MKIVKKSGLLILALLFVVGCGKGNQITFGGVNKDTDKNSSATIEDDIIKGCDSIYHSGNDEINDLAEQIVVLYDDERIEYKDWISKEQNCYRVGIGYREEPENEYSHKRDYFFYKDEDKIMPIVVEYPSVSDLNADRYVYNACDFEAELIDVTFDGNEDLLISLGHAGAQGAAVYCAYIYTKDGFMYDASFEDICNYEIDAENQLILGNYRDNASTYVESKYRYNSDAHKFELTECKYIEYDQETGEYK